MVDGLANTLTLPVPLITAGQLLAALIEVMVKVLIPTVEYTGLVIK
jgi:hypothetical protein